MILMVNGKRKLKLDGELRNRKIEKCVCKFKNNKTGGSDGLVGELLKYGGGGIVDLLHQLFKVVWYKETIPKQWREGPIVHLFKKGDKEDPGNKCCTNLLFIILQRLYPLHLTM